MESLHCGNEMQLRASTKLVLLRGEYVERMWKDQEGIAFVRISFSITEAVLACSIK